MGPTSAGLFSIKFNNFLNNFYFSSFIIFLALFNTLNSININTINVSLSSIDLKGKRIKYLNIIILDQQQSRHRRATTESLLTVEWEGIQSGDHPDSSIRGFIVEYRAEREKQWHVHMGLIPYKGPNHQYRVQIPKLPTGISYFVRIKVLGSKGEVLVETPEIRARNEIVSIKCEPEELTSPNDIKIKEISKYSIAIIWQPPECGSIGEYQLELKGLNLQQFDVHRQTVSQPQASIGGLIPGTEYSLRIRAIDRTRIIGPWSEELITVSTKGELPEDVSEAQLEYIGDKEVRISWKHLDHPRLQHYEIVLTEVIDNSKQKQLKQHKEEDDEGEKVERTRIAPIQNNIYFGDLKPDTEYKLGVLAYVDHESVNLQRLNIRTNIEPVIIVEQKPLVIQLETGEYEVYWKPQQNIQIDNYILEYKLGNETKWNLLTKQEEIKQQNSYSFKTLKLENAVSIRLLFIKKEENKLEAKTEEEIIKHKSIGNSCERIASSEPKLIKNEEENNKIIILPETLNFKWEQIKCDGHIEGWEYIIWPSEDGNQPLEGTVPDFTSQPQVLLQGLEPSTDYRFKVRHRLPNGGYGPWSPTALGHTGITKEVKEEEEEVKENIYKLRIALIPPRSFLVWTPLPEHIKRIYRFKVSHKPTSPTLTDGTTVEGPPQQFNVCPLSIAQQGADFCLDLRGLELGKQYSAQINYQLDGPIGKWSKKGSPLFFILVDEEEKEEEKEKRKEEEENLNIGQIRIEQIKGKPSKSIIYWIADGPMLNQIRAYQVEIRSNPQQPWHPISGYITAERQGQKQFNVEIDNNLLGEQAEIRLKALGSDGKSVAQSQSIETGMTPCEPITLPPNNASLTIEKGHLILRWSFPPLKDQTEIERCHFHFLVGGILNGAALQRTVDGNSRELKLDNFEGIEGGIPSPRIQLSIHAINKLGAGPASLPISVINEERIITTLPEKITSNQHKRRVRRSTICDPRTDFWCREESFNVNDNWLKEEKALISTPTVSTSKEGSLQVHWRSKGPGRGVFGYRVLYKSPGGGWNPYGQIVPYIGDNEEYNLLLAGLSTGIPYELKIQTLDRNSYVLYTSQDIHSLSTCLPPTQPPSQLAIDAPDARHVRVTWIPVVQSAWKCSEAKVELKIDEPHGRPSVFLDARQSSHVFDVLPAQRMTIRARTTNVAGHSDWSSSVSVSTLSSAQSLAEPIDGPFVSVIHGMPRLSWKGREGTTTDPELVDHFIIEWRTRTEQRWNQLPQRIPFTGWQRPYNIDLDQLPSGHLYEVRIRALDHNLGTAFLSGTVTVQSQFQCRPPHSAPKNLEITPLGPNQLRLIWQPLNEVEWNCDKLWYIIKYSSTEQQGFRNLSSSDTSTIFDSAPFTQWHFQIQAANPAGSGPWSSPLGGQTLGTAPGPVGDFSAQILTPDAVQLSWRPPQIPNGQITGYELISRGMCQNGMTTNSIAGEQPSTTLLSEKSSYTLQQLHPHSRYRIGVAARTDTGAGERITREVQTDQSVPTAPPANFRVDNIGENNAELSWHAPPCVHTNGDITEYEYEIAAADRLSAQIPRVTDVTRSTRVYLTGLVPSTSYSARVRAFTARGPGPWSQELRFQTRPSALREQVPQPRIYATGNNEAQLVWQTTQGQSGYFDKFACQWAPTGTQKYKEERIVPAYNPCSADLVRRYQLPPSTPQVQTHCTALPVRQDPTTLDYRVRAKPQGQPWTQWSPPQKPVVIQPPPPPPPRPIPRPVIVDDCIQLLALHKQGGSANSLRFAWSVRPSDLLRCAAFIVTVTPRDGREPARQFRVDSNTNQYTVDSLRPGTVYSVSVQPVVNERPCTGMTVDMTTDIEPLFQLDQRPRIVEEKATSITIAWDVPSTIQCSSFIVEYRLETGSWQQMQQRVPCQLGRSTYTATVPGLPTNSAVDFRVRAISLQNQPSNPSPEVRGHTKCSAPDSPPHGLRLDSPTQNEVRLSWARLSKLSWNCDELQIDIGYRTSDQPERILTVPADKIEHIFSSEPNTRWTVRLRATNQAGNSPWGPEQTLVTRQGAPGHVLNMQLTPLSPNEIKVKWSPPAVQRGTIVGYDISYRLKHRLACPEEEPRDVSRDFVTIYNHKDTEYILTGLLPNSLYEVKVQARTTQLGPEETREGATFQQPPSAPPLNLQLTYALERSLSFQWEPVECSQRHGQIIAYEYEIVGQDDWAKLERQIANTSQQRITIDGLTPYTKYVFRVRAYNGVGGGPATENLDVMTAKANAPLPPQDLVVTQEGVSWFTVSWLPPYPPYGPHDRYKLQYQLLSASPHDWKTIEVDSRSRELECPVPGPRLCYNITNLDQGQQYRVKVAAHIEGGNYGPFSQIVIANTLRVVPGAPASIDLIAKTDHSLHVGWKPPYDQLGQITQYRLSWQSLAHPNTRHQSTMVDHPKMDYLIDGLEPETYYNISLSAGTPHGFGPEIWAQFRTDPFRVPSVLQAPILTPEGANTIHVEWTGVVDTQNRISGYIVESRTSDASQWIESSGIVPHEPGRRQYKTRLDGLEPDTLYFVRIKVVDNNQKISDASPESNTRTGCAPPTSPPTSVALHGSSDWKQVRVSWHPPNKQSWLCSTISYELEYHNGSGPAKLADVASGYTEHSLASGPGTAWRVRVRTKNPAGVSPWSPEVELRTGGRPPGEITDLQAEVTSPNSISTNWSPPESDDEITGYTLIYTLKSIGECGPNSAFNRPITKQTKEPNLDLEGLLPDSTYDITVTAHTATQEGKRSKIVTVRTEEASPTGYPKNLRVTSVTSTRAELIWNEIECELRHGRIIGYEYELDDKSGESQNISEQSINRRVSLDRLIPYTEYRARVRGKNSKGEGPFSDYIEFRTLPSAPPPPTDLRIEEQLAHALEISFLPPHPPNGILDQYRIRWTPYKKFNYRDQRVPAYQLECSTPQMRGRLCYRISGLEPEQEYEIQASAHTEHGDWGDWSEPLITPTGIQIIPVLEAHLELDFVHSTSIGVKWRGLDEKDVEHINGYILEYKSEDDNDWTEWNGIIKHRIRQLEYKTIVKGLIESTEYFFRLRVVGKGDKRGGPGPELKAITKCGKPEQPPGNVRIEPLDFEQIKIIWEVPEEITWKCDQVELALHYTNTSGQHKILTFTPDGPKEVLFDSIPGTRWEAKMRTQTIEPGEEPKHSGWSNKAVLITKSPPSEIFLKTNALGPTQGEAFWGLPTEYTDWPWGVDLQYKLIQLGNCKKLDKSMTQPVILENVQDKHVLLDNLYPGSEYEVTVTLRQPPGYDRRIQPKKAVQRFKTEDLPPTGAPHKLRVENRQDTKLGFGWEPPECLEQNGEISQYEYELIGLEDWNQGTREGVSPRTRADIGELQPGSLYRFRVRAFTSAGPGPWSEPIDARTTGSEIGPPRDLTALKTADTFVELAWLPPHPETSPIIAYRVRYGPSSDTSRTQEIILRGDELTCSGYESSSSILTSGDRLCTTVTGLKQLSTYRFAVQAQAASGNWGPFTPDIFATTSAPIVEELYEGGNIKLLSAGHDNLKIKWTPPGILSPTIDRYELLIALAAPFETAKRYDTIGSQTDYHFKGLNPITLYNITVRGLQENKSKWTISGTFATTDKTEPTELDWLGPPTDLRLIEKSDTMLHVTWTPPDIFEPEYRDLLTHYRVTIAPVDEYTMKMGDRRNYTVMVPGNSIKFTELKPQTIYNITVQGGTDLGYGQMIWGAWATLPTGKTWILRLKDRTPNTLTVEWEPIWGFSHRGYILTAKSLHSIYPNFKVGGIKSFDVSPTSTEFTITGLEPASTYNVTLTLKDQMDGAWGVYSTLPPGWYLPRNLKHCDQTPFATSLSWEPVEANMATEYQVRYIHLHSSRTLWIEEESKHRKYLLCPKDPCGRHCYLVFNLEHNPDDYAFMVRAKVNGIWNNWKLAGRPTIADQPDIKERCCIVPPPYHVDNIGVEGTNWEIAISPSPTDKNITRYYIVVDERDPPGDTNWTLLTDKITAHRLHIPYYVAGSFSIETLDIPTNIKIGNGSVIGGYLNYPLQKGKTYNYEIYTKWMMHGDQPVIGRLRPIKLLWHHRNAKKAIVIFLPIIIILVVILGCFWVKPCYRDRHYIKNGQHEPLIKEKYERYEHTRGNFEDGYSQGYRAGRGGRRVEEDWRGRDEAFREGYAKGLRDTGDRGMSTSMANLAQRPTQRLGYSSGYMQGFRDGSSGVFGDRITESLLKRLEEQYPDNEEFRTGYIDGFKDGVGGGGSGGGGRFEDSKRIQQSLTELTERLTTIEKTVEKGDEIHSTKIYHVYNQSPEMLAQGQQLVNELEELASGSRRSTLRRHYTPGDYLRYDETSGDYNSLGRSRRSMSATALGRGTGGGDAYAVLYDRDRQHSGSIEGHEVSATTAGRSTAIRNGQYRSRSELAGMGGISPPRRYASQTLLDGARPGPTTTTTNINSKEHSRRDALYELQRELDSLASRSPASGIDFISRQQIPSKWENNPALSSGSSIVASAAAQQQQQQRNYEYEQQQQQQSSATTHQWPEDLIEIVHEPMGHTLDRMRRFSTSLSNVERTESAAAAAAESEKIDHQEKYKRTYREVK